MNYPGRQLIENIEIFRHSRKPLYDLYKTYDTQFMAEVPTTKARQDFAGLVDAAYAHSERVVLTRNGKPVAAVIPIEDLEQLEAYEDAADIAAAEAALSDPENEIVEWENVKKRLDL